MLLSLYTTLALNPTDTNLYWLIYLSQYDERVYKIAIQHNIIPLITKQLPSPHAAYFLSRGIVYDNINTEVIRNFIKICSLLCRYNGVAEGVTLSDLMASCGLPEENRMRLFNFSETYRQIAIQRSYFPQRGMLKLLALIFCDDTVSDAVATLQSKSDILNYVNNIYCGTADFISWRFSVRVMSIAGGYNEDRIDVDDTEYLCRVLTKSLPEFMIYFTSAFLYGYIRHYPQRVRGIVPRWLATQRAAFTGLLCGMLGVYINSYLEYKIYREKLVYEMRKSQEYRRRRGAERRGIIYNNNPFFDDLTGITDRVYNIQVKHYIICCTCVLLSLVPLVKVKFPAYMGDVVFRHPFLPRLFPVLVGMRSSSRCLVPYILAPFSIVTIANSGMCGVSIYDRYVEMQQRLFLKRSSV